MGEWKRLSERMKKTILDRAEEVYNGIADHVEIRRRGDGIKVEQNKTEKSDTVR